MTTTKKHLRLNRLTAWMMAAGCIGMPLSTNAITIIGDAGAESVNVPSDFPTLGPLDGLVLGNQASGDGVLSFQSGTLDVNHAGGYSGYVTVGNSGVGNLFQNDFVGGSTINITGPRYVGPAPGDTPADWGGYLFIGRNDGGSGTYTMEGGTNGGVTLNVQQDIQIGGSNVSEAPGGGFSCLSGCAGSFVQRAGDVFATGVSLGIGAGTGTYTFEGGSLNASGALDLGNTSGGDNRFTQTGGTVNLGGMFIANGAGSNGTYTFEDGVLNSGSFALIGLQGTGAFVQNGGVHTAGDVSLGYQTTGTGVYQLNGGTLNVGIAAVYNPGDDPFVVPPQPGTGTGSLIVGDVGQGSFAMTGGTLNILNDNINVAAFVIGNQTGATGVFTQSGGVVNGGRSLTIGLAAGSSGIYNLNTDNLNNSTPTLNVGFIALGNNAGAGTFNQQAGTLASMGSLFVGPQGTYNLQGGTLDVTASGDIGQGSIIGTFGQGALFNQTGGTHQTNNLVIGGHNDVSATYLMAGGELKVNGQMFVGLGDDNLSLSFGQVAPLNGSFIQSGGTVTAAQIFVGGYSFPDSHLGRGYYELSGGTVTSGFTAIGKSGIGEVLQTGGTFNAGALELGSDGLFAIDNGAGGFNFYSSGTYNLQRGTLNTTGTTLGVFGLGTVNQSGGDHNVNGQLTIGFGPALVEPSSGQVREGVYNLSDGNLTVSGLTIIGRGNGVVGDPGFPGEPGGQGSFNQSGGSFVTQGDVLIGQFGTVNSGTGTYSMSGGSLLVDNGASMVVAQGGATGSFLQSAGDVVVTGFLTIGEDVGAVGTYRLSGGTLTAGNTILGGGFVGNAGSGGVGSFEQSGGSFETTFLNIGGGGFVQKGQGFYTLTAGSLTVTDSFNMGNDVGGKASFNQSGGSVQLTGTGLGGGFINNGTYTLSGSGLLDVTGTLRVGAVGGALSGVAGHFKQSGTSTVTVGQDLLLATAVGSEGSYSLTAGVLGVNGRTVVGDTGLATFTQSGGTHTTGQLVIGAKAGSDGTYNMLGGTLNDDAIVGDAGTGSMFVSAGTHNVTGNLILGNQASGNGNYNLSLSGQTFVSNHAIVGNLGTGSLSVADSSVLSVAQHLTVGGAGNGTAVQTLGTVTAGGLRVGEQAGSVSSYTLNGGTLTVTDTSGVDGGSRIGLAGHGTFTQTAGAHNTTFMEIGGTTFAQGSGGSGTYNLNGGTLTAAGIIAIRPGLAFNPSDTSSGTLNVAGGALTAAGIVNHDQLNYSGGSIAADVSNNAAFNVTGGAARTLTGNLTNNLGGTVTVAAATPFTVTGTLTNAGTVNLSAAAQTQVLAQAGGSLNLGTNSITVTKDYTNNNFSSGNSFNARAGVTGSGQIIGQNAAQTITGQVASAGANTFTLDLGNVRGGSGPITKNYQIANIGTGADIRGAIQTAGLGNVTDARLSGSGATAGNFGPIAAGGNSGNLAVTLTGPGTALTGQKIAVVGNFDNVATQVINLTGGAVSALAVGQAAPNSPPVVDLGNFRVGSAGALKSFDVTNQTSGAGAEQLGINGASASSGFAASNVFGGGLIGPGATQLGAVTARANGSGPAGINTGTVTLQYATDGTNVDASFARQAANTQVIDVKATGWNLASGSASPAGPINLGNFHVGAAGGAAPQNAAIDIANSAPASFSEQLRVGSATVNNAAFTLANNIGSALVSGGATALNALNVSRAGGAAGVNTGTIAIQYQSDGTGPGNSGFAAIDTNSQQIQVNATGYRLAQANTIAAVNFGNVHVGDNVSQALSITNTQVADGFTEKLNAAFGAVSDARITTLGSINLLAAGQSDTSSMKVGINTAAAGSINGTARVLLTSDGAGTSGLGQTALTPQDVGVTALIGNVFRLASASAVTPNPVNFGNVRVNAVTDQALAITNTAANDGFSEKLNASIGAGSAGVTTNGGFFNLLGPQATNNTALRVGLDTSTAGAKSGTATITLVSDGADTSGLGQTALPSQTVTITGGVFNEARGAATPDPIVMHRRVGDAATQTLTVTNTAAAGAFSEALNASFQGSTGAAGHNAGGISNLIAGGNNNAAMAVTLDTSSAGAKSGSVTLAYQTDGTGPNGNSGLAAIAAGTQTIGVSGNVYTTAVGQVAPTTIDFGIVHKGDVVGTRVVSVTNAAAITALNDTLKGSIGGASGVFSASGNLGAGIAAGQTDSSSLSVGLATGTAGVFNGSASVSLASHNADMADLDLGSTNVDLVAQVNEYAQLNYKKTGGAGGFVRNGNLFTLDFGSVALGSGARSATLDLLNDILGPADLADGAYCGAGTTCNLDDFGFSGFNGFADLQAGASAGPMSVSFDATHLGVFDDILELRWFGHNASGYRDAADTVFRLHILGSVFDDTGGNVPEPGNLLLVMTGLVLLARSAARRTRRAATVQARAA